MKLIDERIEMEDIPELSLIGPRERLVFFDIETTGLSSGRSEVYLIGCLGFEEGEGWRHRAWFSEGMEDEPLILGAFCDMLMEKRKRHAPHKPILVTYNGEGFDLPFISACLRSYCLPDIKDAVLSFDLYRELKSLKPVLGLPNMKLKSLERYLGIDREDRFSGGELIPIYHRYRSTGDQELLSKLLLHNGEDIVNLPQICRLLSYGELFSGKFSLLSASVEELLKDSFLDLRFELCDGLPRELIYEQGPYSISASGKEARLLNIVVRLHKGELKYFFADHKNYYYLPEEDRAIHKSVGQFVEKKARRQATRETCYQRESGIFLPEEDIIYAPVYYESYKGEQLYARFSEELLSDSQKLCEYGLSILSHAQVKINVQSRG